MKKQTAVEWLMEQILPTISITLEDVCIKELTEIAIEMEKQQIEDAYEDGETDEYDPFDFNSGQKYYNETFGS
jgi:hypothetical protein